MYKQNSTKKNLLKTHNTLQYNIYNKRIKIFFYIFLFPLISVTLLCFLGLYGSHGGIVTFVRGQLDAKVKIAAPYKPDKNIQERVKYTLPGTKNNIVNEIDRNYLSFAIDSSQLVGGKWWNPKAEKKEMGSGTKYAPVFDFRQKKLDILIRPLLPAYLRLGGSEADKIFYDMHNRKMHETTIPKGFHSVLTAMQWDRLHGFINRINSKNNGKNNLKLIFTVNAGPGVRAKDKSWRQENLESLLAYTKDRGQHVDYWELGNELNLYWFIHGLNKHVFTRQYAKDYILFNKTVKKYFPKAGTSAQGSAFWPVLGEPLQSFYEYMPGLLKKIGRQLDTVSWHYYPQQSRRGPIATRRAKPGRLLNPEHLEEVSHWAKYIIRLRDQYSPESKIWMGETGNAQFGGEPGVSDRYLGALWWLDQLGRLAQLQHKMVIRQTLVGMDYGMLDSDNLEPRPDYWLSLLWKKHMHGRVLAMEKLKRSLKRNQLEKLRVYAHQRKQQDKTRLTFLFLNLYPDRGIVLDLSRYSDFRITMHNITTEDVFSKQLSINGQKILPCAQFQNKEASKIEDCSAQIADAILVTKEQIAIAPLGILFLMVDKKR